MHRLVQHRTPYTRAGQGFYRHRHPLIVTNFTYQVDRLSAHAFDISLSFDMPAAADATLHESY